ncbi:unnamed protein product, partial [Coregonus sp. 'balchen']
PRHCVETLVAALQEVDSIPAYLPNCLLLKDTLGSRIPVLDTLTDLVFRAKAIPVWLDPLARLDSLVSDVLCPRCEAGTGPQKSKSKRAKDAAQCSKRNGARLDCLSDVERALSESKDSASAMATLAEVRQKEMESLLALRASNESKLLPAGDCGALRVCVCHKAPSGAMLQCELCRDAFHRDCVLGSNQDSFPNQAWLCPPCQLSEKPPLDRVLPLLASLQRIRVRLPEGDALRFLIERTVRWQHRVQQTSAEGELGEGVAVMTSHQRWASSSPTWALNQETNSTSFYTEHQCIPLQGLSPGLEELMVEGFLLQVTLPETQQLYRSLLIRLDPLLQHHHTDSPFPQHSAEQDQHQHNSQGGSPPHNQEAVNGKRTKRHIEEEGPERKDKAKKPRKKKPKMNKERSQESKGTSSPTATHSDLSLSDSDEDFTLCAAPWCREPEGKQVNWVQCDGSCQQWFHQVCVGVSAEQAEKEDYICISCTQPDHTRE